MLVLVVKEHIFTVPPHSINHRPQIGYIRWYWRLFSQPQTSFGDLGFVWTTNLHWSKVLFVLRFIEFLCTREILRSLLLYFCSGFWFFGCSTPLYRSQGVIPCYTIIFCFILSKLTSQTNDWYTCPLKGSQITLINPIIHKYFHRFWILYFFKKILIVFLLCSKIKLDY